MIQDMVKEFHKTFKIPIGSLDNPKDVKGRITLIDEEHKELKEALESGDKTAILKELCDLVYVVVGTAVTFEMNFDEAINRVHDSNMTKVWPDGTIHYREDGKVLKPSSYSPPILEDLV